MYLEERGRGLALVLALAAVLMVCPGARGQTQPRPGAGRGPVDVSRLAPHPRLLLSPEVLARLKAKAAANDPDWRSVLADADGLLGFAVADYDRQATPPRTIAYAYQGFGWYSAAVTLGLAYNVTGRAAYANKVVELLRKVNATAAAGNLAPISVDRGFPSRAAALGVALGFDWIYPALPGPDRAATVATLNRWFDWYRTDALDRDGPVASNYFGGHLLGFGAAGYATAGDNPRAAEMVARARDDFANIVAPAFSEGPFAGGFPAEGYVYGTNHYLRLLEYMLMVGTATRAPSPGLADYARRMGTNLIHALKPNRWQVPDEADYPGDDTGVLDLGLPLVLSAVAPEPVRANVQHLLGHLGTPPAPVNKPVPIVERLLYWDAARPSRDPAASEPLYYYSRGDEHLFMRSSWGDDAVWASFNGGLAVVSGHQARAAGHLAIQRGADTLLLYAGQWKGPDGVAGQPQQFQNTSAFANTLFVSDGGEYLYDGERYRGGQSPWAAARPLAHAQTADWSWARLDATAIYDRKPGTEDPEQRSVRSFIRDFAYLSPGTFVLFDRVRMKKAGYVKALRFHLNGRGTVRVTGNVATSVVGSSALHVRALLPQRAAIDVAWNEVAGTKLNPRLDIGDRAAGTDLDALTVLTAGEAAAPAPAAALVRAEGGAFIGAQVEGRERGRVILFAVAAGGVPAPPRLRYRVKAAGPARHHLFDMPPRQAVVVRATRAPQTPGTYDVTVAPDGTGLALTTDGAGALVFDLVGGEVREVTGSR